MKYVGYVVVEDASGARFFVYEYSHRRWFRTTSKFRLEDKELVQRVDETHFRVMRTGEMLLAVQAKMRSNT